jgi:hypothetical protein
MILAAIVHGGLSLDDVYQLKGSAQAEEFSSIIRSWQASLKG